MNDRTDKALPTQGGLDLSHQGLASRLTGNSQPTTLRGIARASAPLDFHSEDPEEWPKTAKGEPVPQVNWVGLPLPLHRANLHFLIAGVPGTGKTHSFRLLLQSVFAGNVRKAVGGTDRAVIYGPKLEFCPILRGMGMPADRLAILNPFDRRCAAWDLAADYTTPADAFQLAKTMIPCPEGHQQPFFPKAAAVLTGVIAALMRKAPGRWDLADVVLNCLKEEVLTGLLNASESNPYIVMARSALGSGTAKDNVLAELTSQLFEYLPITSRWRAARKSGRRVSLREFAKSPDAILLLGPTRRTRSRCGSSINCC